LLNLGTESPPQSAAYLLYGALGVYVLLLIFSWSSYFPFRILSFRPDIPTLQSNSEKLTSEELRRRVADNCVASLTVNERKLGWKGFFVGLAFVALHIEAALLSVAAIRTLL
jgi:hypothetical protein